MRCQQRRSLGSDTTVEPHLGAPSARVPTASVSRKRCDPVRAMNPIMRMASANSVGLSEAMRHRAVALVNFRDEVPTASVSRKRCDHRRRRGRVPQGVVPTASVSRKRCDGLASLMDTVGEGCQQRRSLGSDATMTCARTWRRWRCANSVGLSEAMRPYRDFRRLERK